MNKRTKIAGTLLLLGCLAAGAVLAHRYFYPPSRFDPDQITEYYAALRVPQALPVDETRVRHAALSAAAYLRSASDASGRFRYVVNPDPKILVPPDYSIVRHQGAVYGLGAIDALFPDPENGQVMLRAVDFVRDCCYRREVAGQSGTIGITEPEFIADQSQRGQFKLGAAGLGLLALTALERSVPGSVSEEELAGVALFALQRQASNGAFYLERPPGLLERAQFDTSLFATGQMVMGWLSLYEMQPSKIEFFDAARRAMRYLARKRLREESAPVDHWDLLATAELFRLGKRFNHELPERELIEHSFQICHRILEEARVPQPVPQMEGAISFRGTITPTATRLEGMQAALTFLPEHHPIVPHMRVAISRGMDFLLRAQIKVGSYAGGFPHRIAPLPADGTRETQDLNAKAGEIRIDYVQHSLNAMVDYLDAD